MIEYFESRLAVLKAERLGRQAQAALERQELARFGDSLRAQLEENNEKIEGAELAAKLDDCTYLNLIGEYEELIRVAKAGQRGADEGSTTESDRSPDN